MVVFAPQNVLRDPPFSRVDIVTCRNLLIYLEPEIQRRVLSLLHFALLEGGYLFLGNTESVRRLRASVRSHQQEMADLPAHRHGRIASPSVSSSARGIAMKTARMHEPAVSQAARPSATLFLQRALLERYGPPTVVVDRGDQVVYYHGDTATSLCCIPPASRRAT